MHGRSLVYMQLYNTLHCEGEEMYVGEGYRVYSCLAESHYCLFSPEVKGPTESVRH